MSGLRRVPRRSLVQSQSAFLTAACPRRFGGGVPGVDADAADTVEAGASLRARLGYALGAFGDLALASPYSEMETGDGESRLQFGIELRGTSVSLSRLRVNLYGQRDETGEAVERRAMVETRLGF